MNDQLYELNLTVSGRVQGVGFRYFTQDVAKKLGIVGWVRNTIDGKVEIQSFGKKDILENFINYIKQGPSHARVSNINPNWKSIEKLGYDSFTIKL